MRLLFVKHALLWPRSSGHDVHTYYMMKACQELGHQIGLATVVPPADEAVEGLRLAWSTVLDRDRPPARPPLPEVTYLQRRFRSFWGVPDERLQALRESVSRFRADAVVVSGLDALPYLPVLHGVARVWYAADEWILHHLTLLRPGSGSMTEDLRGAVLKGLYERAHRKAVDRVWVVSARDAWAMRWLAGMRHADLVPNGVDAERYQPATERVSTPSAVFWGRLDFGPNIQALEWFVGRVWPRVRREMPEGRFTIIGFHPSPAIARLDGRDGISLLADLPDLRDEVRRHAVAVMPFVSGAGIKNKLLEAAAMGLPIVATPLAGRGLRAGAPLVTAATPDAFAAALVSLWREPARCQELGRASREWVVARHTWKAAAAEALAALGADTARPANGR